jgi:hypothetical protein
MRAQQRLQQSLVAAQELGDEKLQIVQQLQDLIDHKTRQLDQDFKNLGKNLVTLTGKKPVAKDGPILDFGRDEKMLDIQHKDVKLQQTSPLHVTSPTEVNSTQSIFTPTTSNTIQTISNSANESSAIQSNNSGYVQSSNGQNNGNNSERSAKRPRRTRTDVAGNGANTPVSSSSTPMEIDPSDIKIEPSSSNGNNTSGNGSKQTSSQANNSGQGKGKNQANANKKKKRKTGGKNQTRETREDTPPQDETIDPDEPTYCLCDQISFGEMILCDNDLCPIEWFHFSCVALLSKPKGKWFCPNCRGDRPNVMKPKAQFLKELERYNKEKEEKT